MDFYLGMIFPSAISFVPVGFSWCNGVQVSVSQMAALYSLIGNDYGGTAPNNFNLPDLRGRVMLGAGQSPLGGTNYTNGLNGGQPLNPEENLIAASMTINNLPAHTHLATFIPTTGQQPVTIPATPASGSIAATGTLSIVPGVDPSAVQSTLAGKTYYLTGVSSGKSVVDGPYTPTAPGTGSTATVNGVNVSVDTSSYQPAIPQSTVNISAVKGGTVTIGNTGGKLPFIPEVAPMPWEVVTFMICTQGVYPSRP